MVATGKKLDKEQSGDPLEFVEADVSEVSAISEREARGC